MLNIFRIAGDLSHLASIIILLHTIWKTNSIDGISLKTQILYVIVFITRYLNLFVQWISLYNFLMKVFFISSSVYVIILMQRSKTFNAIAYQDMLTRDSFKIRYLLISSGILSLIFHYKFTISELCWSYSLWLESVAILPQLFMLSKSGRARTLTTHYIFALGLYRALYIPNWIWRFYAEKRLDKLSVSAGLIQTLIYSDFFYIYYKKVIKQGVGFELPQ